MKKFSRQQLEVMKILWGNDKPLIASDIVKQNANFNINTVQACLRVLIKAEAIEVADIVYSGTVLCRSYRPLISKDEYFNEAYKNVIEDASRSYLIASLINAEEDPAELEKFKNIINKRKLEIEGK